MIEVVIRRYGKYAGPARFPSIGGALQSADTISSPRDAVSGARGQVLRAEHVSWPAKPLPPPRKESNHPMSVRSTTNALTECLATNFSNQAIECVATTNDTSFPTATGGARAGAEGVLEFVHPAPVVRDSEEEGSRVARPVQVRG